MPSTKSPFNPDIIAQGIITVPEPNIGRASTKPIPSAISKGKPTFNPTNFIRYNPTNEIPNEINIESLQYKGLYVDELKRLDNYIYSTTYQFHKGSIKYCQDNTIRILLNHYIYDSETTICLFSFFNTYSLSYFSIVINSAKPYYLQAGEKYIFTNFLEYFNYQFFLTGVKLNVTITAKGSEFRPFKYVNITESFSNYPQYYYDYEINKAQLYHDEKCDVYNKIFIINFTYDYIFYPIISLFLTFKYDIDYLEIYFESFGGEIRLENNESKNFSNIKANIPYYFYTKINSFQTCFITFKFKNLSVTPFDYIEIYEYKNQPDSEFKIAEKQKTKVQKVNNDESIISTSYQVMSSNIFGIAFKIIPKYNFDYIDVKIDNMGGEFFLYSGINNTF